MKHSTYKKLYEAHLGVIDKKSLLESQHYEIDPFDQNIINLIVNEESPTVVWNTKSFTKDFLSASPHQRLDETFFAFVLRIATIIKEEIYIRSYQKPESHQVIMAWTNLFRSLVFNSLALLYNVQWTPELIFNHLEPTILKIFSVGDALALRNLMMNLGIKLAQDEPYQAELFFEKLNFLQITQFSAFYWRFLHWMAEAVSFRGKEMTFYKNEWRNLLKGPLYRTLRCKICIDHFKGMLDEYNSELMDEEGDLPKLLFKIHNRTHENRRNTYKFLQEPDYTESEYEVDAEFMRQALSALK